MGNPHCNGFFPLLSVCLIELDCTCSLYDSEDSDVEPGISEIVHLGMRKTAAMYGSLMLHEVMFNTLSTEPKLLRMSPYYVVPNY